MLDIGCGNGLPITKALLATDVQVVGIDSAPQMLARFQVNLPATHAVRAIAQLKVIASVASVLKPGGSFLFTAGDIADDSVDHIGIMNGVEFHYHSFSMDGYRRVLVDHGLHLVDFHKDKGENGCYLATKSG